MAVVAPAEEAEVMIVEEEFPCWRFAWAAVSVVDLVRVGSLPEAVDFPTSLMVAVGGGVDGGGGDEQNAGVAGVAGVVGAVGFVVGAAADVVEVAVEAVAVEVSVPNFLAAETELASLPFASS